MKALPVLAILTVTSVAHAESVEELTETARNVARDGRCEALPALGERVRAIDPDYYARVFAVDPVIAGCTAIDIRLQVGTPPALTRPTLIDAAPEPVGPKSPTTALALSAGVTAAGLGLFALGDHQHVDALSATGALVFAIGPTTGHIYAGQPLSAGLGVRALGMAASLGGILTLAGCGFDECHGGDATAGVGLFYGGAIAFVAGGLYEIATAPSGAKDYNRRHGLAVTVVPTGRGLGLAGTF